jgi:hypothetical protein
MTTPTEASAQAPSGESPVRTKLAAAAARAGARKATPRRKTTARKPTVSRNAQAAKRGKYANRIAPAVKSGAALLSWRNPVAGRVIALRADAWAASLDGVAAEDPRVDAFLERVSGWFGKGGAWGDFAKENALMIGGVMVASGNAPMTGPAGMVLAMFAGALVDQATHSVAYDMAFTEGMDAGYLATDEDWTPSPARVAEIAATLVQARADQAAARLVPQTPAESDEPASDEQATEVGPSVFASRDW